MGVKYRTLRWAIPVDGEGVCVGEGVSEGEGGSGGEGRGEGVCVGEGVSEVYRGRWRCV